MDVGQLRGHEWDGDVWVELAWEHSETIDPSWIAASGKGKGMVNRKGKGKSFGKSIPSHVQCLTCGSLDTFRTHAPS